MNPGKLALCLAIPFALAACSGGGGELTIPAIPTVPVEVSLKPLPTQPAQPEEPGGTPPEDGTPQPASGAAKFFPLKDDHLPRMTLRFDSQYAIPEIEGQYYPLHGKSALDTLIPSTVISSYGRGAGLPPTQVNIPQFSEFDFGESNTSNEIPVQRATAEQADRYAAHAYQAILEHSAHIFQAGMRHNEDLKCCYPGNIYRGFKYLPYVATLSTGEKAWVTDGSSGIKGTWKGKAFGIEGGGYRHTPVIGGSNSLPSLDSTEDRIVTANVEITANIWKRRTNRQPRSAEGSLLQLRTQYDILQLEGRHR